MARKTRPASATIDMAMEPHAIHVRRVMYVAKRSAKTAMPAAKGAMSSPVSRTRSAVIAAQNVAAARLIESQIHELLLSALARHSPGAIDQVNGSLIGAPNLARCCIAVCLLVRRIKTEPRYSDRDSINYPKIGHGGLIAESELLGLSAVQGVPRPCAYKTIHPIFAPKSLNR